MNVKWLKMASLILALKASNGQEIGASQMYASASSMANGIASVKKNAASAKVVDNS